MRMSARMIRVFGLLALTLLLGLGGADPRVWIGTAGPGTAARAQTGGFVFRTIRVTGNQRIEDSTIRQFADIPLRKPVTAGQLNAAYQRLLDSGLFEDVTLTPKGAVLEIAVKEYPTINEIAFEGNKRTKDDKLQSVITSRPRLVYSPAQAEADAARLIEAYRQAGRYNAKVTPKIIPRADNRVDLVFEIFEGDVVEIQRLGFVGNRHFSDYRLRKVLSTKQAGILHRLVRSDSFIADRIELDKQMLRDFYLSRGFIDFQVLSVSTEVARARNGFFLTFNIREGQPYSFGQINVTSNLPDIDPDAYAAVVGIKSGATYSPALVDRAINRMETLATKKGLNFVRVTPRIKRNDDNRTLDIEFVLERGPRIFVERIDIEGNATTLDRVIRRQFTTVEGDPFNPRLIRQAAERIRALGFFSNVDVQSREGSAPDQRIIDVKVEEQPTGSLTFGVSYSASTGVGGTIALEESNFLGRGQYVKLSFGGGLSNQGTRLTFREPAFLGRRNLAFEFDAGQSGSTHLAAPYDVSSGTFKTGFTFPISENGKLNLSVRAGSDTISNVAPGTSALIAPATSTTRAFGYGYSYDSRGKGLDPKSGLIFNLSQEFAGAGGSARYVKTRAKIGAQTAFHNEDIVVRAELEGGYLASLGGTTSFITDRFSQSDAIMLGFARNGMGPRDTAASANNDALGGNAFAVARIEATFPLGLPEEYGVSGGVFWHAGSIWSLDNRDGGSSTTDGIDLVDDSMHLRSVIGPLRFNFSHVLAAQAYDVPENFNLTIGRRF